MAESIWSAGARRVQSRGAYNQASFLSEHRKMMQTWSDYLDRLIVVPVEQQQRIYHGKGKHGK